MLLLVVASPEGVDQCHGAGGDGRSRSERLMSLAIASRRSSDDTRSLRPGWVEDHLGRVSCREARGVEDEFVCWRPRPLRQVGVVNDLLEVFVVHLDEVVAREQCHLATRPGASSCYQLGRGGR